jgi:hypothetical protein
MKSAQGGLDLDRPLLHLRPSLVRGRDRLVHQPRQVAHQVTMLTKATIFHHIFSVKSLTFITFRSIAIHY